MAPDLKRAGESRIVLATIGSLGDIHPFIALGLALKSRGHEVMLGVPESLVDAVTRVGIEAVPIMPRFERIWQELGLTKEQAIRRIIDDQDFMIRHITLPAIDAGVRALDEAVAGADAVVGSLFALASAIVAEKHGVPFVPAFLQPMTVFSAYDPPIGQNFGTISTRRSSAWTRGWNRMCFSAIRQVMHFRYAAQIDQVRRAHGLPKQASTPILDHESHRSLRLAFYPDYFAPPHPDFPVNFRHVGFPVFDDGDGRCTSLDAEFERFLAAGPPPLVFTLGSLVTGSPREFYSESVALARAMGMRAVLLTGGASVPTGPDVLARDYAPHSLVFPRAAAVVHHGGIGTTAQALRAGKPQIVVPHIGDQRDNAARLRRLGVARFVDPARYRAARMAPILQAMLADWALHAQAIRLAGMTSGVNGAEVAAGMIESALDLHPSVGRADASYLEERATALTA